MLDAVAHAVLEVLGCLAGHCLLYAVTLGRWEAFRGNDELAMLVGAVFWGLVGMGLLIFLAR
jgi:hypothetical protein